jgi:hypothetical protein
LDEREAWTDRTARELALTLTDPGVRSRVLALLDGHERDRTRRLQAARVELAGLEIRWKVEEGEDAWEA